jgi:DNA phosphorothioation-dependent restriction protein DptH
MSNLQKDERDRLFNAGHKLFFRPADTEMRSYADIAAVSTGEDVNEWIRRLAQLQKGECYSLGPSKNDVTCKLETKAFRIKIASLEDRGFNG